MIKLTFKPKQILETAIRYVISLSRYSLIIFIAFIVCLYGFILLRVNSLSHAKPQASDVSQQVKAAAIPHIDPTVVKKLQALQDNSVSVQSLFNQARSNPFQ